MMMVLRKRDGGVISPQVKHLFEAKYFIKPWKKLGRRLYQLSNHLSRRSWDDLAGRLRGKSAAFLAPPLRGSADRRGRVP